jgi:c-di-AMP phosphodiesterase-like protein
MDVKTYTKNEAIAIAKIAVDIALSRAGDRPVLISENKAKKKYGGWIKKEVAAGRIRFRPGVTPTSPKMLLVADIEATSMIGNFF